MALTPATRGTRRTQRLANLAISLAILCQPLTVFSALAQSQADAPSGTMLLPMTPKLDLSKSRPAPAQSAAAPADPAGKTADGHPVAAGELSASIDDEESTNEMNNLPKQAAADDTVGSDTTLKGTVQIVADDTEFDQDKNTFLGTGNAVALIQGQNSRLEADMILYDQTAQTMDARGNVHLYREGQLTTGSRFKFKVTSDEYLITNPDTDLNGSEVIARKAVGQKGGVTFHNGTLTMPQAVYIQRNAMWGPISFRDTVADKLAHPDGFLPSHPHVKFKAEKMVYEKYKEQSNLTCFGARLQVGNFTVPLGTVVTTIGQKETKVRMPLTPMISNNLQSGGTNIGPRFSHQVGRSGVLSWAPMVQFGGATTNGLTNSSSVGLAANISYTDDHISSHLAYGTVSNLLVADFKYKINKTTKFQSGVNRFLDDGLFGYNRARLRAELVNNHAIKNHPYLQSLNFRSAAGWMQDNPQLLNLTPQYAKLFTTTPTTTKVMPTAFRVSEQLSATTNNLFNVGDDKYGIKSFIYGGVAGRGYSTGNVMGLAQLGPVLDMHLNKVRLQTGYTQAAIGGKSPFVFDEYLQGARSAYVSGDVKLTKYVAIGGTLGENLVSKLAYAKTVTAAFGPDDFKILLSRDMIRGTNRFGFDLLYGQPIPFNKLVLKGSPDQGQTGGI